MSLLLDVCKDRIVGRGKVSQLGWLLERRSLHCFNFCMWREAIPYRM